MNFSRVKSSVDCFKNVNFMVIRVFKNALVSKLLKINKFRGIKFPGHRESPKATVPVRIISTEYNKLPKDKFKINYHLVFAIS